MEGKQQQTDYFTGWGEFQKNFFTQWADSYGKLFQPWTDPMKLWQGMTPPNQATDLFSKWEEMIRETIGKAAEKSDEGLGSTVLSRILRASNVFVVLNEFWMAMLKDLPELYQSKGDDLQSREIFNRWTERYKKVFEQLVGAPVSDTAQEMMTSWLNTIQMHQASMGLMWNPWMQAMPQWREQAEKFMKGDWKAVYEARSLWREVYDETLGRVFTMPAFGLNKQQTERLRRTYDAFVRYYTSIPNFYQILYKTGMEALKEVFDKVKNLKTTEITPEAVREVYKIWWTVNEDAFFELFKEPEFGNAMSEVLNYGLRLKKRLDELTSEWCQALSIPSNKEFDEAIMVIQELRRTVRLQQKAIEKIQQRLGETA
jgi:class III poly(R)-hydroxyalkanoic acid synthase PhaE subunit